MKHSRVIQVKLLRMRRGRNESKLRKSHLLYDMDNLTLDQRLFFYKLSKGSKTVEYWKHKQYGTS